MTFAVATERPAARPAVTSQGDTRRDASTYAMSDQIEYYLTTRQTSWVHEFEQANLRYF